jgi:two-component system KDP operon response regulator KdpE
MVATMHRVSRILLVEDDLHFQDLLRFHLTARRYQVEVAGDGLDAVTRLPDLQPDLVLLDIDLPGIDGLEVCRRIRQWSQVPIIMVTSLDSAETKKRALESGADDYVTKPFQVAELMTHIQAALNRSQRESNQRSTEVVIDDLTIDLAARRVRRGTQSIPLTEIEFDLLKTLVCSPDKMLTTRHLLEAVWGPGSDEDRQVHLQILNLRRKLENGTGHIRRILTVSGVGYQFRLYE